MENYVIEEPALRILWDLAADDMARAEELEAHATPCRFIEASWAMPGLVN
jgi:hypothetical protein